MLKEFLTFIIGTAYAQELVPCEDGTLADPAIGCVQAPTAIMHSQSELLAIILKAAETVVTVAAAISIMAIIYGGIVYATSLGNEERLQTAKRTLFWSLFGLVLTLLARTIVSAILVIISQ